MQLSADRAGPYLRALQAGLHALAPNDAHVSLSAALAHLTALDPAMSGVLLAPAELSPQSGMPAWTWMERARSEAVLARQAGVVGGFSEEELDRARRADPDLADRLAARNSLHRFLRSSRLLPATALRAALRRLGDHADYAVTYDRLAPDGRWLRIQVDLRGPPTFVDDGPFTRHPDGSVTVDPGLQHLLTRHGLAPLLALSAALEEAVGVQVHRLSRGLLGPFWFPGGPAVPGMPDFLQRALTLHLTHELLADDIAVPAHLDPCQPPPRQEQPPPGWRIFRQRRFAVSPAQVEPLRAWCDRQGAPTVVVPLRPRPAGRSL